MVICDQISPNICRRKANWFFSNKKNIKTLRTWTPTDLSSALTNQRSVVAFLAQKFLRASTPDFYRDKN